MIKRLRFRKLANHHAGVDDEGNPRRTVVTIGPDDQDRQLIVEDCSNIIIQQASVKGWQSTGDVMKGKPYAIDVRGGCESIVFKSPEIIGAPDKNWNKSDWRNNASNGLIVREENTNVQVENPLIEGVHYGMDLRGDTGSVLGGIIKRVSADNLCGRGNGWLVDGVSLRESYEIVDYDEVHRDLVQFYAAQGGAKFIDDWTIQNCLLGSAQSIHSLEKPAQIILLSDGIGRNIRAIGNKIISAHDLVIVMSVCIGAEIRGNAIWTMGQCKPQVRVIDERYGVRSEAVDIADNPIKPMSDLGGDDLSAANAFSAAELEAMECLIVNSKPIKPEPIVITENNQLDFSELVAQCRNKNAPAITQQDYLDAGKRLGIGPLMIKAFFQVESVRQGYLPDGSLKVLLERHWVHKLSRRRGVLQSIQQSAGLDNCNPKPGGYQGGKSEYFRARTVCDSGDPEAIDIALSSMSIGCPQIMGFNYKEAGYGSPREMFEHMHLSEKNQLDAFCSFVEAKGLAPLLQKAEERLSAGKSSGKYLAKVAEIYNGKKHKQYDLKIARAYRVLAESENEIVIKPKLRSNTLQGAAVSTISNTGTGVSAIVLLDQLSSARKLAESTAQKAQTELDALTAQAAEPNYLVWFLIGFILLSQSGTIISIVARLRDRFTGKNP